MSDADVSMARSRGMIDAAILTYISGCSMRTILIVAAPFSSKSFKKSE